MKELNYKEAGKYLASLEAEVENKQAALEIARATIDSKKRLESIKQGIMVAQKETDRYKSLTVGAKQEAQDAEDASILRINIAEGKALAAESKSLKQIDEAQKNLTAIQGACNDEAERLNAETAVALGRSEQSIAEADAETEEANARRDAALNALSKVHAMTGDKS